MVGGTGSMVLAQRQADLDKHLDQDYVSLNSRWSCSWVANCNTVVDRRRLGVVARALAVIDRL